MKIITLFLVAGALFGGCASKPKKASFDQHSYDRQNSAAEKSLNSL
ncbi:MAG: hypothetical protein U9N52_01860 [Campylobacterota bacterium]|nr:hypothetical protein [Campylobacterota bacterium]